MSVLVSTRIGSECEDSDQPRMASLVAAKAMVPRKVAAEQSLETARRSCQPAFHQATAQHTGRGRLGRAADSTHSAPCAPDHSLPTATESSSHGRPHDHSLTSELDTPVAHGSSSRTIPAVRPSCAHLALRKPHTESLRPSATSKENKEPATSTYHRGLEVRLILPEELSGPPVLRPDSTTTPRHGGLTHGTAAVDGPAVGPPATAAVGRTRIGAAAARQVATGGAARPTTTPPSNQTPELLGVRSRWPVGHVRAAVAALLHVLPVVLVVVFLVDDFVPVGRRPRAEQPRIRTWRGEKRAVATTVVGAHPTEATARAVPTDGHAARAAAVPPLAVTPAGDVDGTSAVTAIANSTAPSAGAPTPAPAAAVVAGAAAAANAPADSADTADTTTPSCRCAAVGRRAGSGRCRGRATTSWQIRHGSNHGAGCSRRPPPRTARWMTAKRGHATTCGRQGPLPAPRPPRAPRGLSAQPPWRARGSHQW